MYEIALAPDGTRLLYARFLEDERRMELRSVTLLGENDRLLASCEPGCSIPAFAISPTDGRIAYQAEWFTGEGESRRLFSSLRMVDADGTNQRELVAPVERPQAVWLRSFSPDGTRLAFVRARSDVGSVPLAYTTLWSMDLASGQQQQLGLEVQNIGRLIWSDNQHLIYDVGLVNMAIFRIAAAGNTEAEKIANGSIEELAPDRTALISSLAPFKDELDWYTADPYRLVGLDSQVSAVIAEWSAPRTDFAWSPDGSHIALYTRRTGELQLMERTSGRHELLRPFSPIDIDGEKPAAVRIDRYLYWTADSQDLVYCVAASQASQSCELRRFNIAARAEETLTPIPGFQELLMIAP
jgi:dipeptidyl aminopeptidase/acylaminoacyl peptidase